MEKTIYSDANKELTKWLRTCREDKGLTMRVLADMLNVHHSWIAKVELGERRLDIVEYVRICKALDVDPGEGIKKIWDKVKI